MQGRRGSAVGNKIAYDEKDLIKLTLNSCRYLYKLVEIFNSVYKLNFEPLILNFEKFNIVETLEKAIEEAKILLKYHELTLEFNCEKEITINADKTLTVDEKTFKSAEISDIKDTLTGSSSFSKSISSQASFINDAATREGAKANTYTNSGSYSENYSTGDLFSSLF